MFLLLLIGLVDVIGRAFLGNGMGILSEVGSRYEGSYGSLTSIANRLVLFSVLFRISLLLIGLDTKSALAFVRLLCALILRTFRLVFFYYKWLA